MECRAQVGSVSGRRNWRGKEESMDVVSELVDFLMEHYCLWLLLFCGID